MTDLPAGGTVATALHELRAELPPSSCVRGRGDVGCVSSSPFDSFAPMFALVDAIVAAVAVRLGDDVQRRVVQAEALLGGWTWEPEA